MSWNFSLRENFRFATYLGSGGAFRECKQGDTILSTPLASLQVNNTSQKEVYIFIWSPDFCNCCPGDTSRFPGLEISRVYNCRPRGLCVFVYLKSCCLSIWLPINLKLGAKQNPSPWNIDMSWHTLNNRDLSRINQLAEIITKI